MQPGNTNRQSQVPASPPGVRRRSGRRWWQHLVRAAAAGALVVAGLYVSLPWWLPRGWAARQLERRLSGRLGRCVRIDSLSVDWARGAQITNLRIDPSSPEGPPLLAVGRLRASFWPLDLLRDRLEWLEVDQPVLNVRLDAQGLADVQALRASGGRLDRLSLHDAQVRLWDGGNSPQPQAVLRVPSLELLDRGDSPLGRLSLSARLGEAGWISLQAQANPGNGPIAASAVLSLAQVELTDLPPALLAALPVARMSGRCGGKVHIQLDRRGLVDDFRADVVVRDLQVDSISGPLPLIEQALVQARGRLDPIGGLLELKQLRLVVPGLTLDGSALVQGPLGPAGGVREASVRGQIDPGVLAALLGRPELPRGPWLEGPVQFTAHSHFAQPMMELDVELDATGASLLAAGGDAQAARRVLKPAGTKLALRLAGGLDWRTGSLRADELTAWLGDNSLSCRGQLPVQQWLAGGGDVPARLCALSDLQLAGTVQMADLPALAALLPGAEAIRMNGAISGRWSAQQSQGLHLKAALEAQPGTMLGTADKVWVPDTCRLTGDVSATLDADGLREVSLDVGVDQGRLGVELPRLTLDAKALEGRFQVRQVEHFARLMGGLWGDATRGDLDGTFHLASTDDGWREGLVAANLRDSQLSLAGWFAKPAGQDLRVQLAGRWHADSQTWQVNPSLDTPGLQVRASGQWSQLVGAAPAGDAKVECRILDANLLAQRSGLLSAMLGQHEVRGAATVALGGRLEEGACHYSLELDATELGLSDPQPLGSSKARGVPAHLSAWGDVRPQDGRLVLRHNAQAALGDSRLEVNGLELTARAGLPVHVESVKGQVSWEGSLDQAMVELLPAVALSAARQGIDGALAGQVDFKLAGDDLSVMGKVDGTALAVRRVLRPAGWDGDGPIVLHKPAGQPASAGFELTYHPSTAGLLLNDAQIECPPFEVRLDGSGKLDTSGQAPRLTQRRAHLSVSAADWTGLDSLVSGLPVQPAGGGLLAEMEWTDRDGGLVPYANLELSKLTGLFRGREAALTGRVRLTGLRPTRNGVELGRLQVEPLRLTAGRNDLHVLADVSKPLGQPSGQVTLIGQYVDDRDLTGWLVGPWVHREDKLTVEQSSRLLEQAARRIAELAPLARASDLDLGVFIQHLRSFDPLVEQTYDVYALDARGSLKGGLCRLEYSGGVNGGLIRASHATDLNDPQPVLDCDRAMVSLEPFENLQPQLALFFPGNRVEGLFDRTEQAQVPLAEALAKTMDVRFATHPRGQAKAIAQGGLLKGRAVPNWVGRLFPGLNLMTYHYNRMTSFTEFPGDGSARNDMVFSGQRYDIYIEGQTDADNIGTYQIGLILLGTPQSAEWNHTYRQGRIPLLNLRARIEGGQMHDEKVSFLWPNQALFTVFLKNNIFYRLWLARPRGRDQTGRVARRTRRAPRASGEQ